MTKKEHAIYKKKPQHLAKRVKINIAYNRYLNIYIYLNKIVWNNKLFVVVYFYQRHYITSNLFLSSILNSYNNLSCIYIKINDIPPNNSLVTETEYGFTYHMYAKITDCKINTTPQEKKNGTLYFTTRHVHCQNVR